MNAEEITRIAQQIIFSHEGGYGSVNKNDNGALSVGRCQWHAGRALSLLRKICKADPAVSTILGSLYAEIMNAATNWGHRVASDDEAGKISTILKTEAGKAAQDAQAASDVGAYCDHIRSQGVTDPAAIIFMADIENQGGAGASTRIIKAAKDKSLDALYAAAENDRVFSKYMKRRKAVYNAVKQYEEKGSERMAVIIGHASISENGTIQGRAGDQTGKEVCTRSWYPKPWGVYLEPLDDEMADRAAGYMEQICNNNNYGYSQPNRWAGFNSIMANGKKVAAGKGDFDCSSLVLSCYIFAGLQIAASGYTGNMKNILVKTGKFKAHTDAAHTGSDAYAKRGGIYLAEGSHVVMALSNGSKAGPAQVLPPAQNNNAYVGKGIGTATAKTNMNVRKGAGTAHASIGGVAKGQSVEVLEILSSGWYKIAWPNAQEGYAYTSNASGAYYTYKPKKSSQGGSQSVSPAQSIDKSLAGAYVTTANLNLRTKPGVLTKETIILEIPKGETVQNYGYYTMKDGTRWLYVTYNGKAGHASAKYLRKK